MRVLVVNAGSSSLKHALVDSAGDSVLRSGEERWEPDATAGRHAGALRAALADAGDGETQAVGHRVVHGGGRINVQWCHEQAERMLGAERSRRLVVCHLGSGCSVTAVLDGRSVDTTMGFTPLDGVPMGTRSGALDPGLVLHLLASGVGRDELDDALNHRSGLLGIAGTADLRQIERAVAAGDDRAQLAFDIFARGISSAIAAMTTSVRGLDALVFSGGAGERSSSLRDAICARVAHLGVALDPPANARHARRIDAAATAAGVLVVAAGEEIVIARATARIAEPGSP